MPCLSLGALWSRFPTDMVLKFRHPFSDQRDLKEMKVWDLGRKHRTMLPGACTISRISQLIWNPEPWHLIVLCAWFIFWMCFCSQLFVVAVQSHHALNVFYSSLPYMKFTHQACLRFFVLSAPRSALHMILKVMWCLVGSWAVFSIPWLHTGSSSLLLVLPCINPTCFSSGSSSSKVKVGYWGSSYNLQGSKDRDHLTARWRSCREVMKKGSHLNRFLVSF